MEMSIHIRIRIADCYPYRGRVCRQLRFDGASLNDSEPYVGGVAVNCD